MVKKLLTFPRDDNRGYALPLVLVMLAFLTTTSFYLVDRNIKELEANQKSYNYEMCILTAKNGMEEIKALISQGATITRGTTADLNGGRYSYELLQDDENSLTIKLESSYDHYEIEFEIKIELDPEKDMGIKNFFWEMK